MSAGSARIRDLLRHSTLRALLLADLADGIGSWAFGTVFAFVVYDRTHSAAAIPLALTCRWIPVMVLGPFAGVVADRYDRGRLMVLSALGSAVLMGILAAGVAERAPLGVLLLLSSVQAVVAAVYDPAFGAALPAVIPETLLAGANGLREVVNGLAVIGGPAVGGIFLISGEPWLGIAVNAVTYLIPVAVVLRLQIRSKGAGGGGANPLAEIRAGFLALRASRRAVVLILAIALAGAISATTTAVALPISRYVGSGSTGYSYLLIGGAIGSVLAAGVSGRCAARPRLALVITGSLLVECVPFALLVAIPVPLAAFLVFLASGAGMIVVNIVTITALQRDVPAAYLGRVLGLLESTLTFFVVVFTNIGGALVGWLGVGPTLLVVGGGVPLLALAGLPGLRRTDRRTAERVAELQPLVDLLQRIDLFAGADRPMVERVAIAAKRVAVPAGQVLLREGDPADSIWLLAAGRLAVRTRDLGALPDVDAPGYVGEIGVLHHRPRTATVSAAIDCDLYRLAAADFLDALSGRSPSASLLLRSSQRIARTETRPLHPDPSTT